MHDFNQHAHPWTSWRPVPLNHFNIGAFLISPSIDFVRSKQQISSLGNPLGSWWELHGSTSANSYPNPLLWPDSLFAIYGEEIPRAMLRGRPSDSPWTEIVERSQR